MYSLIALATDSVHIFYQVCAYAIFCPIDLMISICFPVVSDAEILRIMYTVSHVRPQMRLKKDRKQPQAKYERRHL